MLKQMNHQTPLKIFCSTYNTLDYPEFHFNSFRRALPFSEWPWYARGSPYILYIYMYVHVYTHIHTCMYCILYVCVCV